MTTTARIAFATIIGCCAAGMVARAETPRAESPQAETPRAESPDDPSPASAPPALTLRALALTQGGVGVFSYDVDSGATVRGSVALDLRLPVGAVADALRSVRVRDPAGPAREVTVATGATALPLDQPDWLAALTGARVSIVQPGFDANTVTMVGRIVRADRAGAVTRLTILTDSGLRQAVVETSGEVKLLDGALRARIENALATTDAGRGAGGATPSRTLRIETADGGPRAVAVDVVLPVPLWKPTWRLSLGTPDADGTTTARLEGWAVVENTGASDWKKVALSLVAGNLVTLDDDVYAVVDVARPVVADTGPTRIAPVADTRAVPAPMMMRSMKAAGSGEPVAASAPMAEAPAPFPAHAPPPPSTASETVATSIFALSQSIDLPAGRTASVPFLDASLPARLIDNLTPNAPHPIVSARIENTTGHTLPAGPVSTSAAGSLFAGDALLGTLPNGQSRLLGFAEDGAVDAAWNVRSDLRLAGLTAANGVLTTTERARTTTTVALTGAANEPRAVLVGVPREGDMTLGAESPKPFEQTEDQWRFLMPLKAGEHQTLRVVADRLLRSTVVIVNAQTPTLTAMIADGDLPAGAGAELSRIVELRGGLSTAEAARAGLVAERKRLTDDEDRVRRNLAVVPATDPFHARLLADLVASENRIGGLARDIEGAQARLSDAQAKLGAAVASLRF